MATKTLQVVAVVLVLAAFAVAPAGATVIGLDQWYTFGFGAPNTPAVDGAGGFVLGQNSLPSGPPSWDLVAPKHGALFTVTDGFQQGDHFEVFDFGVSIGMTPDVLTDGAHTCGNNEPGCLADPLMSHAVFALAPGNHQLTINVLDSPFGGGAAFFQAQAAIPEPATLLLIASGLVACGVFGRRRSR